MIQRFLLTICLSLVTLGFAPSLVAQNAPPTQGQSQIQWYTNYSQALQEAQKTQRPLLLFFTGSDWCGWCKKMQQEIFSSPDFAREVGKTFVFVEIDFPMNKQLPADQAQQNTQLKQKYGVTGYPTVIIVDSHENFVAEAGYRPGGGKAYADYLKQLMQSSHAPVHKTGALLTYSKEYFMLYVRLLSAVLIFFVVGSLADAIEWQSDYSRVRILSQQENKPMLLFFNGSDWAGSAMKMKHEVLNAASFQEMIGDKFICMEVDFPKHTPLDSALAAQNLELKIRFKIQEFPSLLLVDKNERVIAQVGYLPESSETLASDLLQIVEQDNQLTAGLEHLESSDTNLKTLYQLAQELGSQSAINTILEAGLKTQDAYFLLERYRLLVEKGDMKCAEALALRQRLHTLDHENESINGQGIPFTLALIDFQELSQKNHKPEIAAQPLIEYLAQYGKNDKKNVWQVEMMIAQLYLDANEWEEALRHAERAYQYAPEAMRGEISDSLNYIRSASANIR